MAKQSLWDVEGTVACVLHKRVNEINFNAPINVIKQQLVQILQSPEIKQKAAAQRFIVQLNNIHNLPHLYSVLTTYTTGLKV